MLSIPEFVSVYWELVRARNSGDADFQWRVDPEEVLRRSFTTWPSHRNAWEVRLRVMLVNQFLNANLGGSKAAWEVKRAESEVAQEFVERGVDELIAPLARIESITPGCLSRVVKVHAHLVEVVQFVIPNRREQSFCAKYLSIMFPTTVPRYDSKARQVSEQLVGHVIDESMFADALNKEYAQHCQRILVLLEELRSGGVTNPELPQLDHLLWAEGGGYA